MDSNKQVLTGVKKRQQIHKANKAVFIWVAIAGVVVAVALVLAQFLVAQFLFNGKIINAQRQTNETLVKNVEQYSPLRTEVSKLIANQRLTSLRVSQDDNALQVVIDAMPTTGDTLGLAASLQQVIFNRSGIKMEQLSFGEGVSDPLAASKSSEKEGLNEILFTAKFVGTYDQLKKLFEDMQLSIRPISITSLKMSGESGNMTAEIQAKTYYAKPPTTDLKKEPIKP